MPRDDRDELDKFFEALVACCECAACERYRVAFDANVREYTRRLRRSLGLEVGES